MLKNKFELTNYQPLPRGFYAFLKYRCGDFIIFKESHKDYYEFIYIPGGAPFNLTIEDFSKSIKSGMLSFVEQLPEEIYEESLELAKSSCNVQTVN